MEYTENNPLRVFTSFSGYDSQSMALDRLKEMHPGFDYELVGWSEIDRHAIKAHNLVYPQWAGRNFGDITKIDWGLVPDFKGAARKAVAHGVPSYGTARMP